MQTIYDTVLAQQAEFDKIYQELLKLLATKNIFILDENGLDDSQQTFVRNFFRQKIRPLLIPLMIDQIEEGKEYALRISTCAGAWRYQIGDTIKFVDKKNSEIIITGRTKHFLSLCTGPERTGGACKHIVGASANNVFPSALI